MRRLALLVCVLAIIAGTAASSAAADRAAVLPLRLLLAPGNAVRSTPAIASFHYQLPQDELGSFADLDLSQDASLDLGILALAFWVPLAGIFLALILEGPEEIQPQQARSQMWIE